MVTMRTRHRTNIVKVVMIFATSVLYTVLQLFVGSNSRWLLHLSKAIMAAFPSHMRSGALFGFVMFTAEIPFIFVVALVAAAFMALTFRSTSWKYGLAAALVAVSIFFYVNWEYIQYWGAFSLTDIAIDAYGALIMVSCLPFACFVLGKTRMFSGLSPEPTSTGNGQA